MRVTQAVLYRNVASSLQTQYQDLSKIQSQSTSGNRIIAPSDDPTAYYRNVLFSSDLSNVDTLKKTTGMASDRFTAAEQSIASIQDKFLNAQDLIIQLGSANSNGIPQVMKATGQQVNAMYQDVLSDANAGLDGVPLFGGGRTQSPFTNDKLETTSVKMRTGGQGGFTDAGSDYVAQVTGTPASVPMSVKVTYKTTDSSGKALATPVYAVNVDGADSPDVSATGAGQKINVAAGVTLTVNATKAPSNGDAFYFEVIPAYQGGDADRKVKVSDTTTIDGNVTGAQLIGGKSSLGRDVNMLSALTALRGAFLRTDVGEVNALLGRVQEARAQASDMQAITGIRGTQVRSINTALTDDSTNLTDAKAKNTSVDAFDVMSRLSQTTQALQVTMSTQQQVLNASLLNFLK
ncbi:MAG: hypothetical protein HQL66_01825 [Magnetococcales bacterium]|nr:hypothetical protein [Magnetococcales bacterium]